jgi:hypothetical protein
MKKLGAAVHGDRETKKRPLFTGGKGKKKKQGKSLVKCECDGCGYVPDKDEIPFRIEEVNELIDGMQTRMRVISDTIMYCKKGLLHELAEKYVYRLDTCARGIGRLINYKKKLHNLVA